MEIKNKLAMAAVLAGFTVFGSVSSQAAPTCKILQGERHEISVGNSFRSQVATGDFSKVSEITQENLIRLDERTKMICMGRQFCFEEASVKTDVRTRQLFGDDEVMVYVATKATAYCQ